jgi:RNA polymerase sigma-70 factor, ECF subfamily
LWSGLNEFCGIFSSVYNNAIPENEGTTGAAAMSKDLTFLALLEKVRQGDDTAARELFDHYARRLIGLARVHLDSRLRQKLDAEDVVQSVFKSFFGRLHEGQFDLSDWDSLWSLLVVITIRKCGHKVRSFRGQRRNVTREVSTSAPHGEEEGGWETLASDPTPAEALILADTLEQVLRGLKERERRMIEMYLQGHTVPEIAAEVGRSQYTVMEAFRRVRRRLMQLRDEDA